MKKVFTQVRSFEKVIGREPGSYRAIVERRFYNVELTIEIDKLIEHLGRKAVASKSGKSRIQSGIITLKAVRQ